ncbi:MAG: hypothetical protein HFE84_12610 [Lachnospiraceae bacterium]|jgi:hypothetical protein|nr:hypothetical protein [Lachnospiraceae bacterium]
MKKTIWQWFEGTAYVTGFMMLTEMVSYAYIDPSVTTYAIQMIAGVVIAAGAAAGIYWRKAKKKLNSKLGIDENKNKVIEDDVVEIKDEEV